MIKITTTREEDNNEWSEAKGLLTTEYINGFTEALNAFLSISPEYEVCIDENKKEINLKSSEFETNLFQTISILGGLYYKMGSYWHIMYYVNENTDNSRVLSCCSARYISDEWAFKWAKP